MLRVGVVALLAASAIGSVGVEVAEAASLTCSSRQATASPPSADVYVVGDSLTFGEWCYVRSASAEYAARGLRARVDAKIARSTFAGLRLQAELGAALPRQVVFALGTNDLGGGETAAAYRSRLEQAIANAGPNRQILIPTLFIRGRAAANAAFNAQIAKAAAVHPNVVVIGWAAWIAARPTLLAGDGVHLTPAGYRARAAFVATAVTQATALLATRARTVPLPFELLERVRIADSRAGIAVTTLAPGVPQRLQIGGRRPVPPSARAVRMDITAFGAAKPGAVSVLPCGPRPWVWSVNVLVGGVGTTSGVSSALDAYGGVCLLATVAVDVAVDVTGWFGDGASLRYSPVVPARLVDTAAVEDAAPSTSARVELADLVASAPVTGVRALEVVLGVSSSEPVGASVHACDVAPPADPAVTIAPGGSASLAAPVALGADQAVCVTTTAPAFVTLDLHGWYATDGGLRFQALAPIRVVDSRSLASWLSNGLKGAVVPADAPFDVLLAGVRGIPASAVVVAGHVAVFGQSVPGTFSLSVDGTPNPLAPLHVAVRDDVGGFLSLTSGHLVLGTSAAAHVVVDVTGVWR